MQIADKGPTTAMDGNGLRIGLVRARFNNKVTEALQLACTQELQTLGVKARDVKTYAVPGALEVPQVLNALAESGDFDALVAIGCVIRGETYHFELVCDQSAAGVMRVALHHQVPIANAILTVENDEQAWARAEEKGRDAARVAVELANLMSDLP